jgi:hypothetical protein
VRFGHSHRSVAEDSDVPGYDLCRWASGFRHLKEMQCLQHQNHGTALLYSTGNRYDMVPYHIRFQYASAIDKTLTEKGWRHFTLPQFRQLWTLKKSAISSFSNHTKTCELSTKAKGQYYMIFN